MDKSKTIVTVLLLFVFTLTKAQSFQPTVIASAGDTATFSGGSIQWTVGEAVIEMDASGGYFFTQGFNQPDSIEAGATAVSEVNTLPFAVSCYPNPVTDNLFIVLPKTDSYMLAIYNMNGEKMSSYNIAGSPDPIVIPFSKYADGMYMIGIINNKNQQQLSLKVIKSK
jgi:hypothetical protein